MRKLIATVYVSLDGVMETPEEWAFQYHGDEIKKFAQEQMRASDAMLLGRVTYEIFSAFWPTSDDEPYASHMRNVTKYVASTTLTDAPWGPDDRATVLSANLAEELNALKRQPGRNIGIVGSGGLVRSLTREKLIDEYHLNVHPVVLGRGKRLFGDGCSAELRLIETRTFDSGVVLLTYQPARTA